MQEILSFAFVLPEKRLQSWYKTNCDFETAILHYIDGVERKYILRIGLRRFATPPNTEYIFFQLAVNILKITTDKNHFIYNKREWNKWKGVIRWQSAYTWTNEKPRNPVINRLRI